MATPGYAFFGLTNDPLINESTHGFYWVLNSDRTIDWSISNGFHGEYWLNASTFQTQMSATLGTFSYYANVKFNYLGYYTTPLVAANVGSEINMSLSRSSVFFSNSSIWAIGYFDPRYSTAYTGEVGDIYLNLTSSANNLTSYAPGSAGWFLFLHEIGHTLGLKHPHDDGGTGRPLAAQVGLGAFDSDWATIMSYEDTYNWNYKTWDPATPMILDVLALQYIYGKNMSTNAGDTYFTLSKTSMYSTLWDASGNDTVTASSELSGWTIVLPKFQLSTLVDTKAGYANPSTDNNLMAPTTLYWLAGDIENATGGYGNDTIQGNDLPNVLLGGYGNDDLTGFGGSDYIDGGAGIDVVRFDNRSSVFQISRGVNSLLVSDKSGSLGVDTLINVERVKFSNVSLAFDLAPNNNAGMALEFIGVLAPNLIKTPSVVGSILSLFDYGMSLHDTFQLAINLGIVGDIAGSNSNAAVAAMVYRNLIGAEPTLAIVNELVSYMDGRSAYYSQADFLTIVAGLDINQQHIDLVGLQRTGVEFI